MKEKKEVTLPYEVNDHMVIISKEDYERCVRRGLITNAPELQTAVKGKTVVEREPKKCMCVLDIETFHEHSETGDGWVRGHCPHCGRYIDIDSSRKHCDYCFGEVKWDRW